MIQPAKFVALGVVGLSALTICAEEVSARCEKPAPLIGHIDPERPLIGIRLKDGLPDSKASVARIVREYGLRTDTQKITENRFFSDYFTYEHPSPELIAALRCDSDIASIDHKGAL